jgi:hypothetical protein
MRLENAERIATCLLDVALGPDCDLHPRLRLAVIGAKGAEKGAARSGGLLQLLHLRGNVRHGQLKGLKGNIPQLNAPGGAARHDHSVVNVEPQALVADRPARAAPWRTAPLRTRLPVTMLILLLLLLRLLLLRLLRVTGCRTRCRVR